jgi:hypothetical protein
MAATGILIDVGCTEEEVLALRSAAKTELLNGGTRPIEWKTNNSSAKLTFPFSAQELIDECKYALSVLNPTTYGEVGIISWGKFGFNTSNEEVSL